MIKRNTHQIFTDHLNTIDPTGKVQFTVEPESSDGKMAMLDVKIIRRPDGSLRLQIYRKSTHTDQYLMFDSHHPVEHKLSVVRTLLSRKDEIVTEEEDKIEEEKHIKQALRACKYPDWAINRVQKQLDDKKQGITPHKKQKEANNIKSRGQQTVPYVQGVSERIRRVMKKHGIETAFKPYQTLRNILVHPKDKLEDGKKCGIVYQVPCLNCKKVYIGESGRTLNTRISEHRTEAEKASAGIKTRSRSIAAAEEELKSAISEHVRDNNHIMDWDNVSILERESTRGIRVVREACQVRRLAEDSTMNRDDGGYELSHIWDPLLKAPTPSKRRTRAHQPRS